MPPDTLYATERNPNKLGLTPLLQRRGRSFPGPYPDVRSVCEICGPGETWTRPSYREEAETDDWGVSEAVQEGGALSFWDEASEDIYDWTDGEEV